MKTTYEINYTANVFPVKSAENPRVAGDPVICMQLLLKNPVIFKDCGEITGFFRKIHRVSQ